MWAGIARFLARLLITLAILAAVVGGGVVTIASWATGRMAEAGANAASIRVIIPKRSGLADTTAALSDAGLLPGPFDAWLFAAMQYVRHSGPLLRAGEYEFLPHASLNDIAAQLQTGKGQVRHSVTIPEGLTIARTLAIIQANPVLQGTITLHPDEGRVLPETYDVLRDDERDGVVKRMVAAMEHESDGLWANRDPNLPFKNKQEAVVLASIVERETALAAERPHIARVFLNRLTRTPPMRLQSDPTVIYGLSPKIGALDHPLSRKDLQQDTPFNTYTRAGLPPTPICNPGKASLEAVLHPLASDDLYFVADGSGGHAFAATLAEHNRNVAAWLARGQ